MRQIHVLPVLVSIFLGAAPAWAEAPGSQGRMQAVTSGLRPAVMIKGREVRRTLSDEMKALHVPGVSIVVIHNGKVDWARGFGVTGVGGAAITADTLFQAGSVSKPVAAVAALRLVQEGRIPLDSNVNGALKSWKIPSNSFTAARPVTLRDLLSHTAATTVHGFEGYTAGSPTPTLRQVLDGAAPANSASVVVDGPVGAQYRYSGGGYAIAQQLMVDATGQPFPAIVRETVLAPIGMGISTEEQPLDARRLSLAAAPHAADGQLISGGPHVYPEMAAAGLWTSASDLAKFVLDLQGSAKGETGHVLSAETARTMFTPVKSGYGLGLTISGSPANRYFYHDGSNAGYKAVILGYLTSGDGVVVMTNGDQGYELGEEVLRAVSAEYRWPDYRPIERTVASIPLQDQLRFIGTFTIQDTGDFTIRRSGDNLVAEIFDGVTSPLFPASDREFFITAQDLRLLFVSSSDVDHGTVQLGDLKLPFKRAQPEAGTTAKSRS